VQVQVSQAASCLQLTSNSSSSSPLKLLTSSSGQQPVHLQQIHLAPPPPNKVVPPHLSVAGIGVPRIFSGASLADREGRGATVFFWGGAVLKGYMASAKCGEDIFSAFE